jgi:hypothetical protein
MMEEGKIEAKLDEIHAELISLRKLIEQQNALSRKAPSRADDLVGVEYIMQRTGWAKRTILEGKAGTRAIPRISIRPARWRRADVDNWLSAAAERKRRREQPRLLRRKRNMK